MAPVILPATEAASLPGALRWLQSLSMTKPMAMFWPEPVKLKPETPIMLSTSGMDVAICVTVASVASVRALVAPAGSCMLTISVPWSSLGRKDVGRRMYTHTAPAASAR